MIFNALIAFLALAPAACLAQSSESAADTSTGLGVFDVQRLKRNCGQGGCYTDLYVNGKKNYMPDAWSFDAHCTLYGVEGEWVECQTQVPYTPPGGLFVKMDPWNKTSRTYDFWFSHHYKELHKTVNATARMEVGDLKWDVSQCRQMTVLSKEYI
jgi:hypothetical protein